MHWFLLLVLPATLALPATATTINYSGAEFQYTVPSTGEYQIIAYGAAGGSATTTTGFDAGGSGAEIGGNFSLSAGAILDIFVGQQGFPGTLDPAINLVGGGGGGGGSFVVLDSTGAPIVIAGGGGGNGGPGQTTTSGKSIGFPGGEGGTNGSGGTRDGGGGFVSGGTPSGGAGAGFPTLTGGAGYFLGGNGGYGGGGGGSTDSCFGAIGGGGGGYSGGGGGGEILSLCDAGGGGGSFDADNSATAILIAGENPGNGFVTIDALNSLAPESESAPLFALGLTLVMIVSGCRAFRPNTRS